MAPLGPIVAMLVPNSRDHLLPRVHAQRSRVIGSVVVVSTKIARSRNLGEFASVNCN